VSIDQLAYLCDEHALRIAGVDYRRPWSVPRVTMKVRKIAGHGNLFLSDCYELLMTTQALPPNHEKDRYWCQP
jgi:hypothetical protein